MFKVHCFKLLYVVVILPYCVIGWLLRPMDWESSGVVVEGLRSLWSPNCDCSVGWLELSWHMAAWEKGWGLGRVEADARSRRRKERPRSRTVNRLKALRHFW